jgi:hypothetical protein
MSFLGILNASPGIAGHQLNERINVDTKKLATETID